jgi:hypothetical protein
MHIKKINNSYENKKPPVSLKTRRPTNDEDFSDEEMAVTPGFLKRKSKKSEVLSGWNNN